MSSTSSSTQLHFPARPVPPFTMQSAFALRNGRVKMPVFGFGTYRVTPGYETEGAVGNALHHGYRLIDTAALYRNEADVGRAVRNFITNKANETIKREDFFVTTKLWDSDHGYDKAKAAFAKSLQQLDLGYVDLYLMHSPNRGKLVETWDAMLELKAENKVRALGVSNWNVAHLELLEQHGRELPEVNQIELHPLNYKHRKPLLEFCARKNIVITAYGSLLSGRITEMLQKRLGFKNGAEMDKVPLEKGWFKPSATTSEKAAVSLSSVTFAQLLLRWGLEKGLALIPKSVREERIVENAKIWDFELTAEGTGVLDGLEGELAEYWDPLDVRPEAGNVDRRKSEL